MIDGKDTDTTVSPEFQLEPVEVLMLEMEDVLFHLDSAVMMPERPKGKSSSDGTEDGDEPPEDKDKVSGLKALALALKQFEFDPDKRLLIAGHADTSGPTKMNFELSELRSQGVLALLEGSPYSWADISEKRHRIEDYQQILMYMKDHRSWSDCDPVKIDDKWSDDVDKAIRAFITRYNEWQTNPEGPGVDVNQSIPEGTADKIKRDPKHKWPVEMWLAVYNLYNDDIATALQVDRWHLNREYRSGLPFCDQNKKYIACGESYPIDDAEKDNYRSQVNRRVELFFFDQANVPKIDCPARVDTVHKAPECPMWHKYHFKRVYVDGGDLTSVAYYLRFVYYDPLYKKLVSVPDGLQFKVMQNGTTPLTAVSKYKNGVYQLKVRFGKFVDPNRKTLHFSFSAAKKWVYRANADDKGKIVTEAEMLAALKALTDNKQSDAEEKWKYYDLPAEWLSDDWCVRSKPGGGVTDNDIEKNQDKKHVFKALFTAPAKFKPFGNELSQRDKPLVFSLDDLVLADMGRKPIDSGLVNPFPDSGREIVDGGLANPFSDGSGSDDVLPVSFSDDEEPIPAVTGLRAAPVADIQHVALLDEEFAVINPDTTHHQSYYTEKIAGSVSANGEITGLMISGYIPYFGKPVHGVVADNKLYAVFRDRITAKTQYIGHRAAVYGHGTKCEPIEGFQQRHYRGSMGNFDCYLLPEHGFEAGEEISYVFSHFRWHFQDKVPAKKPDDAIAKPEWINKSIKNIVAEWNDETGGFDLVSLLAVNDVTKQRVYIRFYMQHVDKGQHTTISVLPKLSKVRSHMGRNSGEFVDGDTERDTRNWLVAAHEFGHAGSLDDEYLERWDNCCYRMPGFVDFKLGSPYDADEDPGKRREGSMMNTNQTIRARHYWHYAEWLRSRLIAGKQFDFVVCKTNSPDYKIPFKSASKWLPQNSTTNADHYYNYPTKQADNQTNNQTNSKTGKGNFNLYLYPLGEDAYSNAMPRTGRKFTALLIVKVNLRFQFWDPPHWYLSSASYGDIYDALGEINLSITKQFAKKNVLKICGYAPYTETLVMFQPRYLVNNYTKKYAKATPSRLDTKAKYVDKLSQMLRQPEAKPHYEINVKKSGISKWDHDDPASGKLDLAVGDASEFWQYFAEMIGLKHKEEPSAKNFAVGNFVPNGTVKLAEEVGDFVLSGTENLA